MAGALRSWPRGKGCGCSASIRLALGVLLGDPLDARVQRSARNGGGEPCPLCTTFPNGNGPFTSDAVVPATDPQSPNLAAAVANSVGVRRRIGWTLRVVVRQVHRWASPATGGDPLWALGCRQISRGLVSRTSQRLDQVVADAVNTQGRGRFLSMATAAGDDGAIWAATLISPTPRASSAWLPGSQAPAGA